MKALSVRQPWAWAIIEGHKTIENRKWHPREPMTEFAIHAPKTFDDFGYRWIQELRPDISLPHKQSFLLGGIIGIVSYSGYIEGCHQDYDDPWFFGPFGWLLSDPRRIDFIPYPGNLMLFDIDLPEADIINELIKE